jgi:hypothetical protein
MTGNPLILKRAICGIIAFNIFGTSTVLAQTIQLPPAHQIETGEQQKMRICEGKIESETEAVELLKVCDLEQLTKALLVLKQMQRDLEKSKKEIQAALQATSLEHKNNNSYLIIGGYVSLLTSAAMLDSGRFSSRQWAVHGQHEMSKFALENSRWTRRFGGALALASAALFIYAHKRAFNSESMQKKVEAKDFPKLKEFVDEQLLTIPQTVLLLESAIASRQIR